MRRLLLFWTAIAAAQRGGVDWNTGGNDAQRSSWVRTDSKISPESLGKPGFQFLWKIKLDNEPRHSNSLSPMILLDKYTGYRGHKSLGFLGGGSDNIIAMDTDLGLIHWQNHVSSGVRQPESTAACPGGMTSALTRPASAALSGSSSGGGRGRGGPAQTGAGKPGEGAVTLAELAAPRAGGSSGRTFQAPAVRPLVLVYALTSDGMLQTMYVSNGADAEPPTPFLPPNANAAGLIVVDNVAYAATANRCGGVANGVWALDLASKKVTSWDSGGAGSSSPAFGPDGTLYVTAGSRLVALEPKTLKVKGSYSSGNQEFSSSPVVFAYKDKIVVAAAARGGSIHLVDSGVKALSHTATTSAGSAPLALASWQDAGGARWILSPDTSSIAAWKVTDRNGAPVLQPGWKSREMASPLTPAIVNGVVFAVSAKPAVLYAFDGVTGRELWNSGHTIGSFVDTGGLSAGYTQVYLGAHDGTLYAFGFPIEH
jgi:outer membrane protein assembly factor BamB